MRFWSGSWCAAASFLVLSILAGCESGSGPATRTEAEPVLASSQLPPSGQSNVIRFVRLGQGGKPHAGGAVGHIAIPVSLNGGPPRAFILDTGAPVTTVLISEELLSVPAVAKRLTAARPARIRGISGATAMAYETSAKSIAVGSYRVSHFPYVLMSAERDLGELGGTPYGPVVGILGNDFLSQYRVTVDYRASTVSLEER
jgi:hypothetical protein